MWYGTGNHNERQPQPPTKYRYKAMVNQCGKYNEGSCGCTKACKVEIVCEIWPELVKQYNEEFRMENDN